MTTRRFLLAVDLDDATDTTAETIDSLTARLGPETCFDGDGNPIHGRLASAAEVTDALAVLLQAAQIGIDGLEDPDTRDMVGVTEEQVGRAREALAALGAA